MTNRITPFYCGTQFLDWTASNCERCTKSCHQMADPDAEPTCEIELALVEALWDDGTISAEIAERMGYTGDDMRYVWPCRETIWCDWWPARNSHSSRVAAMRPAFCCHDICTPIYTLLAIDLLRHVDV